MTRALGRPGMVVFVIAAASVVAALPGGPSAAPAQSNQRTIMVSVLDRNDAPVPDLGLRDFTVREDGVARELVRVAPAPPPTHVAVLVDDSQVAIPLISDIRKALTAFANLMADQSPVPAVRLTTFGDRPTTRADFTSTFSGVSRAIDLVTPTSGSGAMFLEAVIETSRDLRTRRIEGGVILAFVIEQGREFSNSTHTQVADALKSARASLWTVVLQDRSNNSFDRDQERRERDIVIGDVTTQSGGRNKVILSHQALLDALTGVGNVLLTRYEVTYGRSATLIPPTRLEVTARDRSWKVQASRWPAE